MVLTWVLYPRPSTATKLSSTRLIDQFVSRRLFNGTPRHIYKWHYLPSDGDSKLHAQSKTGINKIPIAY